VLVLPRRPRLLAGGGKLAEQGDNRHHAILHLGGQFVSARGWPRP
jgi:hypothetical protein